MQRRRLIVDAKGIGYCDPHPSLKPSELWARDRMIEQGLSPELAMDIALRPRHIFKPTMLLRMGETVEVLSQSGWAEDPGYDSVLQVRSESGVIGRVWLSQTEPAV